jgi:1-acyl-sn-glycerol-3-phosphate acyltransferase
MAIIAGTGPEWLFIRAGAGFATISPVKLDRFGAGVKVDAPGVPTRAMVRLLRGLRPLLRLAFRPTLEGADQLPKGPFILVANHGAGLAIADLLCLAMCWLDRFGADLPLAGFAHPFAFRVWPFTLVMRGLGAVPSTYAAGRSTLARGVPLVVFPGGDHEACQSVLLGDTVDFAGRSGFVKLALEAEVPLVPMGVRGSHYPAPVLLRSRALS